MTKNKQLKITVYDSKNTISFFGIFRDIWNDFPRANQLGKQLFKRDIKALYRQSLLGFLWAFIPPLITALIWILLNGSKVVSFESPEIPYPVYVLIGTLLWQVLTESISQPLKSTTQGKSILIKLNFPREALLLNALYTVLFNATLKLLIIIAVLFLFKITPGITILYFPFYFFGLILIGITIGILLIPIGMLYQDIVKALPIFMQFLMYLTPVIYIAPSTGFLARLNQWNVFSFFIQGCRNTLTLGEYSISESSVLALIIALFLLIVGVIIYRFVMPIIVERSGS